MSDPAVAWINYNGKFHPANEAVLTASNQGFRYGDGLFETMLVQNDRIRLEEYHFDRLLDGIRFLRFKIAFTREDLAQQILGLCKKNGHTTLARVRLAVFRGEGGLFDAFSHTPHFIIESSPLTGEQLLFNENGLRLGIYPDGRKACDRLANLKSNNFLLYSQAARYALDHQWADCLVLNSHDRVADSCIANLFYTRQNIIYTPSLSEGCVAGVMRRFLLERLPGWGFPVREQLVTAEDLDNAEEIFLTNALKTIRWVGDFEGQSRPGPISRRLFEIVTKQV